jgi:hypothetical protein
MPLHLEESSSEAAATLVAEIRRRLAPGSRPRVFLPRRPESLVLPRPLSLYSSTLQAAADGNVLEEVWQSSWYYLVLEDKTVVGFGEVLLDGRFVSLANSPAVRRIDRALARLAERADVVPSELNLRMLRVPALSILAVWLHGQKLDRLIALPPTHGRLRASQLYTGAVFAERLKTAARIQIDRGGSRAALTLAPGR